MYFEGPEKKLEIAAKEARFLSYPEEFWTHLVKECGAVILSQISGPGVKAYLLSESSLFVWDHKILMITCGQTELIKSAQMIIAKVGVPQVESFYFERKNEYYPEYQKSFALEDFKVLKKIFHAGKAYRFGNKDDHHLYLFEYGKCDLKAPAEQTLEILIYGICDEIAERFLNSTLKNRQYLEAVIKEMLPEFSIDQHWFEPCGYSMNALSGDDYVTIHVTPEKEQSYISFEMNNIERHKVMDWVKGINKAFGPRSFDLIYYDNMNNSPLELNWDGMKIRQKNYIEIGAEFGVSYYHWETPNEDLLPPLILNIE